jgi:hypothetical protein
VTNDGNPAVEEWCVKVQNSFGAVNDSSPGLRQLHIAQYRLLNQRIADSQWQQPHQAVSWLGAVQAQDYLGSLSAVGARTQGATEKTIEQAIADRAIVRTWPMRGTLHFVAASDVRWMLALLTPRILARSKRRFQELELDDAVLARSEELLEKALQGGKQLQRDEIYRLLEQANISTASQRGYHILWRAAQQGHICLGPRSGKQQTFALLEEWVPTARPLAREEALVELTSRYFTSHGPATPHPVDARCGYGGSIAVRLRQMEDGSG